MSSDGLFVTNSAYVAAYAVYGGLGLIDVQTDGPNRFVFELSDPDGIGPELVQDFRTGRQVTTALELLKAYDEVKREIWAAKTGRA